MSGLALFLSLTVGPAFAADLAGWFLAGSRPAAYSIAVDPDVKHSGAASARLESTANRVLGFGTMMQNFAPTRYLNTRLRMSGWVRSRDVEQWAGLWMRVDGPESNRSLSFDNMSDRPITKDTDWTEYSIVLDVPGDATNIAFGILLTGTGTVWLDDLGMHPLLGLDAGREFSAGTETACLRDCTGPVGADSPWPTPR